MSAPQSAAHGPVASVHMQQQYAAAMAAQQQPSLSAAYPSAHTLGGGSGAASLAAFQSSSGAAQHSANPAMDATFSQALNGVAQYAGTGSYLLSPCQRTHRQM